MPGFNYHFTVNPVKQTIKLRPTMGTYAKAFAPTLVLAAGFAAMAVYAEVLERRELKNAEKSTNTDD